MAKSIAFFDTEIGIEDKKIHDIGAVRYDKTIFHSASVKNFRAFISNSDFVCGHNIINHDIKYLTEAGVSFSGGIIDTLHMSPILFPKRPYHSLLKNDKLQIDELNNPVNDSRKAEKLFYDEVNAFIALPSKMKRILCCLLYKHYQFKGFFDYLNFKPYDSRIDVLIKEYFRDKICENANVVPLINNYPVELAYALALINVEDVHSITPPWVLRNYPKVENTIKYLRGTPCEAGCEYCKSHLDIHKALKRIFGYDSFRTYNGEPLQEKAAQAAVEGKSILAVFPTGGGKSITFQLPALIAGQAVHGLTVVISPLQSLMKDQVDNLNSIGITDAVTVNGLLDPIERANALERISNGSASLLYISPEQLRSKTIERMLVSRNIARFVIDEAHCFSAWGQDFRVDYLYIGDFIKGLQNKKKDKKPIPVSCFTATAKQKVISDICDYFKRKLDLDLEIFATSAARRNLKYTVLYKETDEEKYNALRDLIAQKNCPTIVYVSRTKRTRELAERLMSDGFKARPFNGKMDPTDKVINQDAFIKNDIQVIVATSAFGMGVDKKDVKLVVHFDISSSLEDYVQEAGRAGRDPSLDAECYVLFNDNDLDKHFILLNQTKLSISEIQQVWKAIKDLTRMHATICCSPLEIARQAGWDDSVVDIETRVKTAISALENAGYVKRGYNVPHVYATSIIANNMQEAARRIDNSPLFEDNQRENAKRIIKSLISSRSIAKAGNDEAESRVDYLADILGMTKDDVISAVNIMRQEGLLEDSMDMSAYIFATDTENRSRLTLERFAKLEGFLLNNYSNDGVDFNLKELNELAQNENIVAASVKNLRTLMYFHTIKNYIRKSEDGESRSIRIFPALETPKLVSKFEQRIDICRFILKNLFEKVHNTPENERGTKPVNFSLVGLFNEYKASIDINKAKDISLINIEDALLYLSKIGALRIEGGFLVLYNGMEIKRLITDNRVKYKLEDYRYLDEFYKQKIRQVHIVGEYANLMVKDYAAALQFVQDYFQEDFRKFIAKYFKGERIKEIDRNITPEKYNQLFNTLSDVQSEIINDAESKYIVVAAGPGSGKTRVLVHKLAALLLMEDVKHEQLLMVTFSRAAATEFKKRLMELVGNAASFIEIKTFHSYCFDLLGKIGNLEAVNDVVVDAAKMIESGEVEPGKITKSVLVIDEAQDMDSNEFNLVKSLMQINDDMRVIAVGDDDQNIYEFRGSDSAHLRTLIDDYDATMYEMTENYRSKANIISFANKFVETINQRMKTLPVEAVQQENGIVQVIHHKGKHMTQAIVDQIESNKHAGKVCVLTNTNNEALQILGLLNQRKIRAKLIQSMDGFSLYNLTEIRYFLKAIDNELKTPVIPNVLWEKAKHKLFTSYADSSCIEICKNLIRDFETVSSVKYRSDLDEFIKESNYEDFYDNDTDAIYVSTIHKSKGREFDVVYMLLNGELAVSDEDKRKIYVGLTRAKNELYIHCNTALFSSCNLPGVNHIDDNAIYGEPTEISLQMTHRDVVLDFFKGKKEIIFKLHSGRQLFVVDNYLCAEIDGRTVRVAKFSKAFSETITKLGAQGYQPYNANVRFVVAWKGEDDEEESAVLLANLYLKKQ